MTKTIDTIDAIAHEVFKNLTEHPAGQERVRGMDELVKRLNAAAETLRRRRATLRTRSNMSFSVNTTQVQSEPLQMSVRVHGVDCGVVVFDDAGRMFSPSTKFEQQWSSGKRTANQKVLEWGKPGIATFIKECRREADSRKYGRRESSIQDSLFRAMEGSGRKKTILRGFQPVVFGGVPIQIPLPVTPRGVSKEPGRHKGHSDVLARALPHGRLVVFEVKRPAASRTECEGALDQAVRYAAALDYLMSRDEHRPDYWRLLGSRRGQEHFPGFSAVAFLAEAAATKWEPALQHQLDKLLSGNRREYKVSVMLYRETSNGINVTREIEGREKILEVAAEGGSLSVLRTRSRDGAWRFIVLRDETTLADLLDSNDQEGLAFSYESGSVDTLAGALQLMDRYPWHRFTPLSLHEKHAVAIMAEVLRRGGTSETARWKSELSRRSDSPSG